MKLENKTKNITLITEVIISNNFFTRLKGLLGKSKLPDGQGMIITPCKSIHTFFMKFPIDVVFIDKNYRVVEIIKDMAPGHTSSYVKNAWAVIEMPVDKSNESKIGVGDQLQVSETTARMKN